MKTLLNEYGTVVIRCENELENYAMMKWCGGYESGIEQVHILNASGIVMKKISKDVEKCLSK